MPKVVIDNREVFVTPGTRVIEAAQRLGIMIPRFCYHPALGAVGACRVCAVQFVDGPVKGIQMSCMVQAADGMVVSTTDEEVVDFRRHVVEWLMVNHPHDCPVCDEGGQCLLQDMTISGGHGIRRYPGRKRTYPDQHLGPLIAQEMNRCIHCYRCARYYQEFTGYTDLGVLRIGNRVSYGRYMDGVLESPFAGNLVDLCPTGVFTDKPARYKGRHWDTERSPSICIHCSLGCHTTVSARYREIVRIEARTNRVINGHFICDRGRYGFYYANRESRPRQATITGRSVTWNQACQSVSERLKVVAKQYGSEAIVCLSHTRSSVETHAMLLRMSRAKNWRDPVFFMDAEIGAKVRSAISRLTPDLVVSLAQVPESDVILAVGVDPINEAPMLALALRQAHRQGARIIVVDPRPVSLPFGFHHVPVGLNDMDAGLGWLIKATISRDQAARMGSDAISFYATLSHLGAPASAHQSSLNVAVSLLRAARRPLIVCGTSLVSRQTPGLAADFARLLNARYPATGLFYMLPGANAFGAGLLPNKNGNFDSLLTDIEAGRVCALIVAEADPFHHYPDHRRLARALDRLDLLVVMDYVHTGVAEQADVVMPTETVFEAGGIYINQEGRAQRAACASQGGVPISQTGAGSHPPRDYQADRGGDCLPAWLSLACLADRSCYPEGGGDREALLRWLAETVPAFDGLIAFHGLPDNGSQDGVDDGVRLVHDKAAANRFSHIRPTSSKTDRKDADRLHLISMDWIFGTEELSCHSACLRELADPTCLFMHTQDADRLALNDGDRVMIALIGGEVEMTLRIRENMAAGVVFVPRHGQLTGKIVGTHGLRHDQIRKVL